jgi:hypothetical protein
MDPNDRGAIERWVTEIHQQKRKKVGSKKTPDNQQKIPESMREQMSRFTTKPRNNIHGAKRSLKTNQDVRNPKRKPYPGRGKISFK